MATVQRRTVQSLQGVVEVTRIGTARAGLGLLAVACAQAFDPLARVSQPVLGMELRGYGKSRAAADGVGGTSRDANPYRLTNYMADFDAALNSAKWRRAALFGYSHSGFFAAAYALARPERVSALVLVEPAIGVAREELLQRARLAQEGRAEDSLGVLFQRIEPTVGLQETSVRKAASAVLKNLTEERALVGELMARADHPITPDDLKRLEMPVLVIGGTRSHVAPTVSALGAAIPFASVFWIRGARHTELMSAKYAGQVGGAVDTFLSGAETTGEK